MDKKDEILDPKLEAAIRRLWEKHHRLHPPSQNGERREKPPMHLKLVVDNTKSQTSPHLERSP